MSLMEITQLMSRGGETYSLVANVRFTFENTHSVFMSLALLWVCLL